MQARIASKLNNAANMTWATVGLSVRDSRPTPITGSELAAYQTTRYAETTSARCACGAI